MENVNDKETLDNTNDLFSDYFQNMDLDSDIRKIYDLIDNEDMQDEFEKQEKLTKLKNENHKRYYDIDIIKLKNLPYDFDDIIKDILKLYNFINSKDILIQDFDSAQNTKKILDSIYRKLNRLDRMVKVTLKELNATNDKMQSKFSISYFKNLNIDDKLKEILIEKYNDLILYNSVIIEDEYEDLKRQVVRNGYINEILKLLHMDEVNRLNIQKKDRLKVLNKKIDVEIQKYNDKIHYLEDLMPEGSKHINEFNDFKEFCNKLIAYDDTNYDNAKQTYEILCDESKFKILINNFEELFIQEIENNKIEEKFVYEKFGIKNIRTTLNYIKANYMDFLDDHRKNVIEDISNSINSENYDLNTIVQELKLIVKDIWVETITDVCSYNPNEDYYFICTNNQFRDEKYQAILISKKEINRVDDYSDYKIGFICEYNDNILYITENDDIMTVEYDDMSNLKTPLQLEQEFINFRVCNRIALNGYKTKISAVYYINDGNKDNYFKAVELANLYKLPLIELKKYI